MNANIEKIVESYWMRLLGKFVVPAMLGLLITVGGYEVAAFNRTVAALEMKISRIDKTVNDISHVIGVKFAEQGGDSAMMKQLIAQGIKTSDGHELRIRALEQTSQRHRAGP